ncbi:MAG: dimethyl sulfoxide reductase anchor subunit family protein, partial [Bacteroidota bacterium]
MHNVEWSLVIFTLFSQFSVGILISMLIYQAIVFRDSHEPASALIRKGLYSSLVIKVIALVVSFLHLSAPQQSVFALSNLAYSWLSREILMASLFAFLVFLSTVYIHYPRRSNSIMVLLMSLSAISGLYLVYAMARLYMIPTVPVWNTPFTLMGFVSSIFVVSPVLVIIFSIRMSKSGIVL